MYYVKNAHPAIITREVFNKVQEETARRKAKSPLSKKTTITASGKYSKYALTDVLICGECGSRYKRCTWSKKGKKKIVWRCVNRLDYGTKYCKDSPSIDENKLHQAIVNALNKFNAEDAGTYQMLMKATIGEAIGLNGGSDEIDMLERRIEALNKQMIELISESVKEGKDVESNESEFKEISDEIAQLKNRITAIQESQADDESLSERLALIQRTMDERAKHPYEYDDSVVRQMIECVKVYKDGRLEIIFGGGYMIKESLDIKIK